MEDVNVILERHDQHIKSLQHQIDDIREEAKEIHRLTESVSVIAQSMKDMNDKVDKIDTRLGAIEFQPLEELRDYKGSIIRAVITGVVGVIIGALMTLIVR